ncbi:MAG: hypothetical protein K0U47_00985 [Epsilonproteobacteria bacterium]|nr:hypothetical protein [Campylobacterota bacterium]
MQLRLIILSIFITLGFSACATKIAPEKLKKVSSIGIISLHGKKIETIERGITIFGNEDNISDISNWKIDKFITKKIKSILSYNKNYTVKTIDLSPNTINTYLNFKKASEMENFLKKTIEENNIDLLIVMLRGNYVPETYDITTGIAIVKAKSLGMEATNIKLNLYLRGYALKDNKIDLLHHNHLSDIKIIENNLWKDTKKTISDENLTVIEQDVKTLLDKVLKKQLIEIGY